MEIKIFNSLPREAASLRTAVFVEEQGFKDEFDVADEKSLHLVMLDGDEPVATARIYRDCEQDRVIIGRIAVAKSRRKAKLGSAVVRRAEEEIAASGESTAYIHAQLQARGFYEKLGYLAFGAEDEDEGCPHVWMKKTLKP